MEKIIKKKNRVKWILRGILYTLILPYKLLVAVLLVSIFVIWLTIFSLILVLSFILWLGLIPVEVILFILTGWINFLVWPKLAVYWWIDIDTWFGGDWIDEMCTTLFCFIEDYLIRKL